MATAAIITGLALSSGLSIASGISAKRNADAQAKQMRRAGEVEADDRRREAKRLLAAQQVAFAAGGVSVNTGTPLDVLGDTFAELELGALRAQFLRESDSDLLKKRGAEAKLQGFANAGGTILGGFTSFQSGRTSTRRHAELLSALNARGTQ